MRQFLLLTEDTTAAANTSSFEGSNTFSFTKLTDGNEKAIMNGEDLVGAFYISYIPITGNPIKIPVYDKHFSWEMQVYDPGITFAAEATIPEPTVDGHFTLVLVKRGLKFNERNRWTATVPVKVGDAAADIAAKLAKYFENNATNLNITVSVADATITVTGNDAHGDFALLAADDLAGLTITQTSAVAPLGDAKNVIDLAQKAAADAGYLHTYKDADVNPGYPFLPSAVADSAVSGGYRIFTLRFAVPRQVKTRDEVVHQIVQIAVPESNTSVYSYLNELLLEKSGEEVVLPS